MNILFVIFGGLSVGEGAVRSIALLRAMADAGHHVDVIAARVDVPPHPNIQILVEEADGAISRRKLKKAVQHAMRARSYDVVHAVDDAVLHVAQLGRMKRARIVYEPIRCFSGASGSAPSWQWKWFPNFLQRLEKKALERSAIVFSSCDEMTVDLRKLSDRVQIVQLEDIPSHPLFPKREADRSGVCARFEGDISFLIVCRVLSANPADMRTVMLAARKVIEKVPHAVFCFKGIDAERAVSMSENLDIHARCRVLPPDDHIGFLEALDVADVALFVPHPDQRYRHGDIMTMLNSSALVVAVRNGAYASLLNEKNCVQVESTATAIADGLLRGIREPLLSYVIALEAQTMVAQQHSFSSFKYKIRMAYHELLHA